MREIKFRCWIKPDPEYDEPGKMVTMDYSGMPFDEEHECRDMDGNEYLSSEPIWMQFTGLKDKNGKEIYDGDIVKHHDGSFGKVVWNNELAQFLIGSGKVMHRPIGWPDFEVIGNIYENPELLAPSSDGKEEI